MQDAGKVVAASAPISGPYALAAFDDAIFYGNANLGDTLFVTLQVNSDPSQPAANGPEEKRPAQLATPKPGASVRW